MTKWTCCGKCMSRCLDSDYMGFQKIVLYFSCTGHCTHFLKCMIPLPLNSSISFPSASSNQLWSPAHCPYSSCIELHAKTQSNIIDFWVFRCTCFFDGEQFWCLGVCIEIRVVHIMITLCATQSCIHSSFAFTPLENMTFRLEQYVFQNWPLKLCLRAY